MIVPEDGAGMRNWRITSRRYSFLKAGIWTMCIFLTVGFAAIFTSGILYSRMRYYKASNEELVEAARKLDVIAERLERYQDKERKLRAILGSDLELPEAMVVAPDESGKFVQRGASSAGGSELDNAIAAEEAKLRHMPTQWPVDVWQVTRKFQSANNPRIDHLGIDILAADKAGIVASGDGTIKFAGHDSKLGRMIIIEHGNGWETRYGHLGSILVKPGQEVRKGALVAVYGESGGLTTGNHLHFGMYYNGQPMDPLQWLEKKTLLNLAEKL